MIRDAFTLPPLDGPFAAWLEAQPNLHQLVRVALGKVRLGLISRNRSEFAAGREAAQFVRSVADKAGFHETAQFYYTVYEWFCLRLISL